MPFRLAEELLFMANRKNTQHKSYELMEGKLCIITGATSGVGYETAKQLVLHKSNLVIVARNKGKAEKIKNELLLYNKVQIDVVIADFSRLIEVQEAAEHISCTYQHVDALINCAALYSTKKKRTEDGYELVFCVNHLASLLFTLLLYDLMVKSAPARIIQVNSERHRYNGLSETDLNWQRRLYTGGRGYGASKAAQLLSVWELHEMFFSKGVTINAVHPGDVKPTNGSNYGVLYQLFNVVANHRSLFDADVAGESIFYLASSPNLTEVSGRYFNLTHEATPAKHVLDRRLAKRIFDKSVQMIACYL